MQGIAFDGSDSTSLLAIVEQRFLEGGPAVWLARHLLELELDDDYEEESRFASIIQPIKPINNSQVFIGNPAQNEMYLNCDNLDGQLQLELYNIIGLLVKNVNLKSNVNVLNVSNLVSGLYLYKLFKNNSVIQSGKLIIQNE